MSTDDPKRSPPPPFLIYGVFLFSVAFLFLMCFLCGAVIQGWA
jgi:hypothetical protein